MDHLILFLTTVEICSHITVKKFTLKLLIRLIELLAEIQTQIQIHWNCLFTHLVSGYSCWSLSQYEL